MEITKLEAKLKPAHRTSAGYALFVTILFILTLSLLALGVSRTTLVDARLSSQATHTGQAETLAFSAIELTALKILGNPSIAAASTTQSVVIGDATISVGISDEAGRIDINEASEAILSAAFAANGTPAATALNLAAAIGDWRDVDDSPTANGAEITNYQALGLAYGPRNAPFETLGELRQVRDMTDGLYACISPVFTVYGDRPTVDFDVTPQGVLDIYAWAQSANWLNQDWTIPNTNPNEAGEITLTRSDGSGASLRLDILVTSADRLPQRFGATIRTTRTNRAPFELLAFSATPLEPSTQPCS